MTYYCPVCERNHQEGSKVGKEHKKYANLKKCPNCGSWMPSNIIICWYCGECIDETILNLSESLTPKMTNLQRAVFRTIKKLRKAKTSTIAREMQVDTKVIIRPLIDLRKKGMIKSRQGKTEMIWTRK